MTESRFRAVLQATGAICLVGIYLIWWLSYTSLHLAPGEYRQLAAGQTLRSNGADFRLDSLTRTEVLTSKYDDPTASAYGTVWIVARLTVTKREASDGLYCALTIVGPGGRVWKKETIGAPSRDAESCPPEDTPLGQPFVIEAIFVVPAAYADQLAGVTLPEYTAKPDPVLVPVG